MNPLKLLILLAWFVSIESWTCFVFPISGTGIIRLIFDGYYFFLGILVSTQDLLMVLNSIAMISGLFLRREVFILCISTSENFSGFKSNILKFIPSSNSVYNCHNPRGICLITRLTLGLSHLREYKFIHGFQDTLNPLCSCGNPVESTNISSSTVPNLSMKQALSWVF